MAITDVAARTAKPREKEYKLTDSHGLYLLVKPTGSKRWYLKYRFEGKESRVALGAYPLVSLAKARDKRDEIRLLLAEGISPNAKKEEVREQEQSALNTFEKVAKDWHSNNKRWSSGHAERVWRDLERNILPTIGARNIADLSTRDLLLPLREVEMSGRLDVASRLQQRITGIMRYAVQSGLIDRNPAQDLAGAITSRKATHRPALPLEKLPDFLQKIECHKGRLLTRLALQLCLNVFIRSSELRFARWKEIDLKKALWTIPAEREAIEGVKHSHRGSKMRTTHLVPLSHQAITLLQEIRVLSGHSDLVFPGDHHPTKPLSENTINNALRGMGYDTKTEVCGHGFRAMACSALVESGLWSRDAVERQMSHQERNGVRAAYIHKAEHLEERRLMVQWWADYLDANVNAHTTPFEFAKRYQA
ncbi:TPA: tyrosine-type recombinase/integrase [Klebsiella pneumoniae]|uniref:tyrosine-type recombinase/integrase n=1 Tax=Klebsiella pneumoniae TaxID=573 RepID=UPI00080291E5|nr:integrase arm-type DNA-binding domain-containing protein [Klebsiella pneumoniae]EKY0529043.1 tyrosine-type recombinase/integrase [Klebsiella pneumoniae]SBG55592.1 phage integrase family site-specific recombinase [Klebsiella pneumoniae]HBQ3988214.1 tyrosine-type recombinase/integrase [Klebsiella pneumoniae]